MVFALSKNQRSARGREATSDSFLAEALGESLRAVDQEYSGLVHQPAGLVGPSHSGVVSEAEVRSQKSEVRHLCRHQTAKGSGKLDSRRRHARHLVFIVALGVRNDG